ncbi:MAG: tetratricopeptide repeat protein [Thermoanaerobaculia bacterium]
MKLSLHRPVAAGDELGRLEDKLVRARRRFRRLLRVWLTFSMVMIGVGLISLGDVAVNSGPPAPMVLILVTGILITWRSARVLVAQPRVLAAQRELLGQRNPGSGPTSRSIADRRDAVRSSTARLRRQVTAFSPPRPELAKALDEAAKEAAHRFHEIAADAVRAAREAIGDGGGSPAPRPAADGERQAGIESFRLALANVEIDILLERDFSATEILVALERARRLLAAPALPSPPLKTGPPAEPAGNRETDAANDTRPSIAVLPFSDLSPGGDYEYFCHGLAEELINALTQIRQLRVVSTFGRRDRRDDGRELGRKLGVETLLEGSVRAAGSRLRVTASLVRVADGVHLWSQRYDRDIDDVFAIQDEITAAIIDHLKVELLAKDELIRRRTTDLEAYHLYLKGRFFFSRRGGSDLEESIELFRRAIDRDPEYALAWAGLADSYNILGYYSFLAPREAFPQAKEAAAKALALDGELAEAHCSSAFSKLLYDWDWNGAEAGFQRSFELNPAYATAHHWYSEQLSFQSRHNEAIAQAERALELDPLSRILRTILAWTLFYARHYEQAIAELKEALELDPSFGPAELWLALCYEQIGQLERAAEILERSGSADGHNAMTRAALGRLYAELGRGDAAAAVLQRLQADSRRRYVPAYHVATVHAALGDHRQALDLLDEARGNRDNWLVFLDIDPVWDDLRSEPRFAALRREVGLPPAAATR